MFLTFQFINRNYFWVKIDKGTHARSLELKLNPLEPKALNQNATNVLEGCCVYLLNHLPVEDEVVRYLQFSLKEKKSGLNAFPRLRLAVGKTLGSEGDNIKIIYDLCDKVK